MSIIQEDIAATFTDAEDFIKQPAAEE